MKGWEAWPAGGGLKERMEYARSLGADITEGEEAFILEASKASYIQGLAQGRKDPMTAGERKTKERLVKDLRSGFHRFRLLMEPFQWTGSSNPRAGWFTPEDLRYVIDPATLRELVELCIRVGGLLKPEDRRREYLEAVYAPIVEHYLGEGWEIQFTKKSGGRFGPDVPP